MCKVDFVSSPAFSLDKEKLIRFLKKYAENDGFTISQIQYNFISQPGPVSFSYRPLWLNGLIILNKIKTIRPIIRQFQAGA